MNTTENNKLIAEFMQLEKNDLSSKNFELIGYAKDENSVFLRPNQLKYNSDWNWLIPVVEKCRDTDHYQAYTHYKPIMDMIGTLDILNVYQAVVEFIKWHNKKQ